MPVAHDIESDIHPLRRADARIHFVFQPIFRNFLLHHFHVPGVTRTEVSAAASEAEASFSTIRAERAVRSAHRSPLAVGHHVVGFFHRLWFGLLLGGRGLSHGLSLRNLVRDRNGVGQFFFYRFRLGQRLCNSLPLVSEHILGL